MSEKAPNDYSAHELHYSSLKDDNRNTLESAGNHFNLSKWTQLHGI